MLSVKAHLQCSELPLLQSTLEKVDSWDISSPQKTADEVSWRCWWRPVSFSLCCFHNLQEPSSLQPWQALAPGRPQRTAGMKKQGAGLPWGIGWQPAQVMERRLGQRLLTRVPSAEEACWSGTGRENPSGCPPALDRPADTTGLDAVPVATEAKCAAPIGEPTPSPTTTSVRRWGRGQGDNEANTSSARPAQHGASPAPPTSGNPAWPSSREPQRPAPSRLPPRRRRAAAARWRIRRVSEAGRQGDRGSFLPFPSDRAVSLSVPQLLSRTWSWWTWSWASCPPGWPWETSPPVASWGPCEEVRGAEGRGPARPAETAPHPLGRRGPGGCESLLLTELGRSVHKHLWLLERILAVAEGSGSRGAASGRFLLFQNSASCCLLCSHL